MKLTLIYDNEAAREDLEADWGFSCLVEVGGAPRILFDTGASGAILLANMRKLDIDPASIDTVFISHPHWDHIGGLPAFLEARSDVAVYVPSSAGEIRGAREVVYVSRPVEIHDNVFSTGELRGIEQSLAVRTDKGVVLIVGCSHPGMANILEAASRLGRVRAVIGGLHGFSEFELFKGLELICPAHCTQHKAEIRSLYPETSIDGGAGKVILL